jgi:hypothetical protein
MLVSHTGLWKNLFDQTRGADNVSGYRADIHGQRQNGLDLPQNETAPRVPFHLEKASFPLDPNSLEEDPNGLAKYPRERVAGSGSGKETTKQNEG